jgi:enoyl-CoA hydratase/carnithine racemase
VFETLLYGASEGIATLTLNRPEQLNAFTSVMRDDLLRAFDEIDRDDAVRVVIVTGAGRAFCAGGEVAERAPRTPGEPRPSGTAERDDGGVVALRIFRCLKPMIAACNGAAVGFGATFQLPMDIRLASEKARYGFPFARLGVVPEAASSWFLPRLIGVSRALEWCLTGQLISAREAQQAGLVRTVYAPDELMPAALALARTIADSTAPVSAALTRLMLWRLACAEHPMDAHIIESRIIRDRKLQRDIEEGIASFLQKRPSIFADRVSQDMPPSFPWREEPPYQ